MANQGRPPSMAARFLLLNYRGLPSYIFKCLAFYRLRDNSTYEVIWFDFQTLCFGARSQQDYLYLAEHYRFVLVSGVSWLSAAERNEACRLTWLIDVLYDYRVKWCATFEVLPEEIYTEGDFAEEFTRTVSRMQEMQSEDYLRRPHLLLDRA